MSPDANSGNSMDQAVSRALRENLERIKRTSDELHQAVSDVVSACSSSRPGNALPAMLRAQTSAASISATLDILARFLTSALQGAPHPSFEPPPPPGVHRIPSPPPAAPPMPRPPQPRPPAQSTYAPPAPTYMPEPPYADSYDDAAIAASVPQPSYGEEEFDVNRLSPEEQELHRRANRVAKVSMQDIKMLRPEQVRLGRENRDLCIRLRDDIEKAHREYDRRFKPIMDHPVDYFYRWLVEILADGDPNLLGEYPYATPARQR
jgi:hypothetical protein